MSGFGYDQYKKLRKNDAPGMIEENNDQFERFFSDRAKDEIKPALDSGDNAIIKYEYDPEQLMQHFEDRNKEAAEFDKRTEYFFKESRVGETKASRYSTLAQENNQTLNNYSRAYSYHCASKRKSYATKASGYFTEMQSKMKRYSEDENRLTSVQKYARQEEIMSYRIKGMHAAAVVKAQSSKHGDFLSYKGKLSCYMILKDQLEHFIENETNVNLKRELESKRKTLNKNIKSAYEGVKKYAPKAVDVWREKQHMDSAYYKSKQIVYKKEAGFANMEKTKLLADLEKIQEYNNKKEWPSHIVFRDQFGAVLSKAENNYDTWNYQYSNAQGEDLEEKDMEAVKRFENLHVPTPKELANISEYIRGNLRDYYDLCKRALPYYTKGNLPDNVEKYINKNSALLAKIEYVKAVDQYIDFALRNQFEIRYDNSDGIGKTKRWGKFTLENERKFKFYRDPKTKEWKRDEAFGWRQEDAGYKVLQRAFERYQNGLTSISNGTIINSQNDADHNINLNIINNINLINVGEEFDKKKYDEPDFLDNSSISESLLDNSIAKEKRSDISEDILDLSSNKININEDKKENIIINNEPVFINKNKFDENVKIFEEKKEEVKEEKIPIKKLNKGKIDIFEEKEEVNLNKINIIEEEDKKEEKKKIDQDKMNIFEPKKVNKEIEENPNKINIIEEEDEKEENLNTINIIKEENSEINAESAQKEKKVFKDLHKFDDVAIKAELEKAKEITGKKNITVDDIAVIREIRAMDNIGYDNEETKQAFEKAKAKIGKRAETQTTIDRFGGPMLRVVHYDKDGKPASEEDKINHKWNLEWFEAVEKANLKKQQEMIEKEIPNCFDGIELPKPGEFDKWIKKVLYKNPKKVLHALNKSLYVDNLKITNPLFAKYLDEHPIFKKMSEVFGSIYSYLDAYLKDKVGFDKSKYGEEASEGGYRKKESRHKGEDEFDAVMLKSNAEIYAEKYKEYKNLLSETKKFKAKNLSFETKEEKNKRISVLKNRNGRFSGKDALRILDAHDAVNQVYKDQKLKDKLKKAVSKKFIAKGEGGASTDLSRIPGSLLRVVHYDKNMQPIGEKDLINAAWNNKVMTAFENGDAKELDAIIKEEIPRIYDGLNIPKPPKNAGAKWFMKWIELNILSDPEKWFEANRRITALGNLVKANKTAKKVFEENKEIKALDGVMTVLNQMVGTFLQYKYRINIEKSGDERVIMHPEGTRKVQKERDDAFDEKMRKSLSDFVDVYGTMFEMLESETPNNKYVSNKSLDEQEFENLNKHDPSYTKASHGYKKRIDRYLNVAKTNPIMQKAYAKGIKNFTGCSGGHSIERDATFFMKHVEYDEEFRPLTEQDKKNHEWNLKWLKAWEDNDLDLIQDMIGENVESIYENFTKIPEPTQKELDAMEKGDLEGYKEYTKKLEEWADQIVAGDSLKFIQDSQNVSSIDTLRRTVPSLQKFTDDNPKLKIYTDAFDHVTNWISYYISKKYHVNNAGDVLSKDNNPYDVDRIQGELFDQLSTDLLSSFAKKYKSYLTLKNNKTVPFKKIKDEPLSEAEKEALYKDALKDTSVSEVKYDEKELQREVQEAKKITGFENIDTNDIIFVKEFRTIEAYEQREDINKAKEKAMNVVKANNQPGLSRYAGTMMRTVHFDSYGNFLTEKDKRNSQWNLTWLEAVEKKDYKKQKEMMEAEVPHLLDDITLPKPEELEKWVSELARNNPANILNKMRKCFFMDNVKNVIPDLKQFLDENPIYEQKRVAFGTLMTYIKGYLKKKIAFDSSNKENNGFFAKKDLGKTRLSGHDMEERMYKEGYKIEYDAYNKLVAGSKK